MTAEDVRRKVGGLRVGRSGIAELIGLSLFGLFLAAISAYDTEGIPPVERYLYWQLALVGGGSIAAMMEPWIARLFPDRPRVFVIAQLAAMTPAVSVWVAVFPVLVFGRGPS